MQHLCFAILKQKIMKRDDLSCIRRPNIAQIQPSHCNNAPKKNSISNNFIINL